MKRILSFRTLREFWEKHPDSEQPLKTWYSVAKRAIWLKPADVKKDYAKASILKEGRVVFDIKKGSYRLVVKINYKASMIFIRFIGTHSEYDDINANEI